MENFKQKLRAIKCFVFDVDGVLTDGKLFLMPTGDPVRVMNTKDGYAMREAISKGYRIIVISGRGSPGVKTRLDRLDIEDALLWIDDKKKALKELMEKHKLSSEEILFMGDDIVDVAAMKICGIACCPADAVPEVKEISIYISDKKGGEGCVRDVIEQVMRLHGKWREQ
jgi:3-deoxy-D-manno-octulosonate 8-phosphate phosphatase (KDO 8-P phosphatase)